MNMLLTMPVKRFTCKLNASRFEYMIQKENGSFKHPSLGSPGSWVCQILALKEPSFPTQDSEIMRQTGTSIYSKKSIKCTVSDVMYTVYKSRIDYIVDCNTMCLQKNKSSKTIAPTLSFRWGTAGFTSGNKRSGTKRERTSPQRHGRGSTGLAWHDQSRNIDGYPIYLSIKSRNIYDHP